MDVSHRVAKLIELGRDREAAELAVTQGTMIQGGSMDVLDQLDMLGPLLATVVGGIRPDQLDNPTPCAQFTVRGVLDHMVGGATMFSAAFRGVEPTAPPPDAFTGFGAALTGLAESMHSPGALDRTIEAPFGPVPGDTFGRFVVLDGLVHGWDLATATGQPYSPPEELVDNAEAFAREAVEPLRDGDTFAAAVDAGPNATPIERLAAFTGRAITTR